jgi:predicted acyl esterase
VAVALSASPAQAITRTCTETKIPMSDGVQLHAWVARAPALKKPRPTLFMMDSYARSGHPGKDSQYDNACPEVLPDDYVPSFLSQAIVDRFDLVQVSYRGTGASGGLFDMTGPRTQRDIHEAIRWTARRPWSSGRIVVTGESGTGFAAFHTLREKAVKAAVIFTSCADMYRCFYRGGTLNGLSEVYLTGTRGGYLGAHSSDPQQLAALTTASADVLEHPVYDDFWKARSALGTLPKVRKPVMYTTDLYDIVAPWDALRLTPGARLDLGMGHTSPDVAKAGGQRYLDLVRAPVDRFVAHYGLGDRNGAQRDPRVTLVTNAGGGVAGYRAGQVVVRQEARWPLPGTDFTRLPLSSFTVDRSPFTVAAAVVPDLRTESYVTGATGTDLRGEEAGAMTFTTPVLTKNLELSGPITVDLAATATTRDFDWVVRVTDVAPDGSSNWITDGRIRGADKIDVSPTSAIFRTGHRLRIDLLPAVHPPSPPSVVTVDPARSTVTLPVIPDRCGRSKPLVASTPPVTSCARTYAEATK